MGATRIGGRCLEAYVRWQYDQEEKSLKDGVIEEKGPNRKITNKLRNDLIFYYLVFEL